MAVEITASLKALILYNNSVTDMVHAATQERRNRLQHKANVALCIYLRTRNAPYLADRLPNAPEPPKPCQRCNGRGVIEGAMEFSWVGGYPDARVYVCDCMIEDNEDVPF